jgi:hypothetical protein
MGLPFVSIIIRSASAFLLFYLFADLKDQLHVIFFANLARLLSLKARELAFKESK